MNTNLHLYVLFMLMPH